MSKKILIIGATGTIGRAVVHELSQRHTIISANRRHDEYPVDMSDISSIERLFAKIGALDAVIVTAGKVAFADFDKMRTVDYAVGLNNKLMGQVNIVLVGRQYLNDGGSFTLTSGILSQDPIRTGSSAAMVNAAIDGFVKAAAIELPRGIRINSVSPTIVAESLAAYGHSFLGFIPTTAQSTALAYVKSVEGLQTGQVYRVGY